MPPHAPPDVRVDSIACYDNWDTRECAVSNAAEWRAKALEFISAHDALADIPRHIHQIWIGTREPPCVWLDTWRFDFMGSHGAGWQYTLWDNDAVAALRAEQGLVNDDLYERESMWQCKADLLRLELLYRFGGVYIDADLVSLGKPIEHVLQSARATGFGCSFEADSAGKRYSVLGNSIIFASKGHPVLELLIHYIRKIYDHKRPHFGVEWVTGPLAFTKALIHSDMPITIIPREYFYSSFHFVPNPDSINLDACHPDALGFQFGYTCSGLRDWVKHNNRCRRALDCPHHKARTDYPLGAILPFANEDECVEDGDIPKVIHQFQFSAMPPSRWSNTWAEKFCADNPQWSYRTWSYDDLKAQRSFFCAHLYPASDRRMDEQTMRLLALEVLFKHGGYYVPLTSLYAKNESDASGESAFPPIPKKGLAATGGIIGSTKNGLACLKLIKSFYALGKMPKILGAKTPCCDVSDMRIPDAVAAYQSYPTGSRFLGASRVLFSTVGKYGAPTLPSALVFAYDAQVPLNTCAEPVEIMPALTCSDESTLVFTDPSVMRLPRVVDAIAGLIYRAQQADSNWDYITLSLEWCAGVDEEALARVYAPMLADNVHCFGVVVNRGRALRLEGDNPIEAVLARHEQDAVYAGTVRFAHNKELSSIYSAMPLVGDVFWRIAQHNVPSWDCDEREVHGRLLKGLRGGQLAFELNVDDEHRVMYRAFNDDGGMNCEARIAQGLGGRHVVEHARVYFDHAIVFEGSQICL